MWKRNIKSLIKAATSVTAIPKAINKLIAIYPQIEIKAALNLSLKEAENQVIVAVTKATALKNLNPSIVRIDREETQEDRTFGKRSHTISLRTQQLYKTMIP